MEIMSEGCSDSILLIINLYQVFSFHLPTVYTC